VKLILLLGSNNNKNKNDDDDGVVWKNAGGSLTGESHRIRVKAEDIFLSSASLTLGASSEIRSTCASTFSQQPSSLALTPPPFLLSYPAFLSRRRRRRNTQERMSILNLTLPSYSLPFTPLALLCFFITFPVQKS
jgi:hypothetical protein